MSTHTTAGEAMESPESFSTDSSPIRNTSQLLTSTLPQNFQPDTGLPARTTIPATKPNPTIRDRPGVIRAASSDQEENMPSPSVSADAPTATSSSTPPRSLREIGTPTVSAHPQRKSDAGPAATHPASPQTRPRRQVVWPVPAGFSTAGISPDDESEDSDDEDIPDFPQNTYSAPTLASGRYRVENIADKTYLRVEDQPGSNSDEGDPALPTSSLKLKPQLEVDLSAMRLDPALRNQIAAEAAEREAKKKESGMANHRFQPNTVGGQVSLLPAGASIGQDYLITKIFLMEMIIPNDKVISAKDMANKNMPIRAAQNIGRPRVPPKKSRKGFHSRHVLHYLVVHRHAETLRYLIHHRYIDSFVAHLEFKRFFSEFYDPVAFKMESEALGRKPPLSTKQRAASRLTGTPFLGKFYSEVKMGTEEFEQLEKAWELGRLVVNEIMGFRGEELIEEPAEDVKAKLRYFEVAKEDPDPKGKGKAKVAVGQVGDENARPVPSRHINGKGKVAVGQVGDENARPGPSRQNGKGKGKRTAGEMVDGGEESADRPPSPPKKRATGVRISAAIPGRLMVVFPARLVAIAEGRAELVPPPQEKRDTGVRVDAATPGRLLVTFPGRLVAIAKERADRRASEKQ